MSTERVATDTWTVPTEMSRSDGIADLMAMLGSALLAAWLVMYIHVPIWAMAPIVVAVAIFVLSGEQTGDIRVIGVVSASLRSALGLRRIHEWLLAWWHFFQVRQWPDFKAWVHATTAMLMQHIQAKVSAVRRRVSRSPEPA